MSSRNILYISYDGMTDPLGQSQVLPYIIGLSGDQYSFTLVSCEKPERYKLYEAHIRNICVQHNIDWQPLMYTARPPVLSTIKDVLAIRQKAFDLHGQKNFAMVHCRSYISALIGLEMKKKFGVKFLFDMRGFWADERVDGNLWNLKNPLFYAIYKYFKNRERAFLNNADGIVSLTENGKIEIKKWASIDKGIDITVIPCCVDMEVFDRGKVDPASIADVRAAIGGKFILGYYGSIGTWYLIDEMLDFFKVLLQEIPGSKFLLVTPDKPELILPRAKEKNIPLESIEIRSAQRREMPLYIAASDASVFFIKPSFSKISSSPTKHGEIMSMGVPVVCNDKVGDLDKIISHSHSGILIRDFNEAAYREAIILLKDHDFDAVSIREACNQYYSLTEGVKKYEELYRAMFA